MIAKAEITIGCPEKTFYFVCWVEQTRGVYKAKRNKEVVYVPSYRAQDGEIVLDMMQPRLTEPTTSDGSESEGMNDV